MKNGTILLFLVLCVFSCKKKEIEIINPDMDYVSFQGVWTRTFDAAGNEHTAKYEIKENSIHYKLEGVVGFADYTIIKDSYEEKEGRWIGHTEDNKYYLLFFKGVLEDKITMYKEKVENPNEAQTIKIPSDDTAENYGWNSYTKVK